VSPATGFVGTCNAWQATGHYVYMEKRVRFELLYARHAPAVKAYVLRRSDASSADDVVAEVFVVCWRRFHELPADTLPWLLGVARRVLSTQRRSERRRAALEDRLAATAVGGPREGTAGEDGILAAALARLSDADRELLLLIAWDGLLPNQAAEVLGVKATTARVRLMRARRRLSQALAREQLASGACVPIAMEVSS
jgi:RNA polymerase sigma-70 factor (ECF subfamily)